MAPFAIGEQIKAGGQDLLKEFGTEPATIKDHREPSLAHQAADLFQQSRQHLDQTGVGLGRDDEQRIAARIIDPIIRSGRHGKAHAGHVGFGQRVFAVIHPHVAIKVEKAQGRSAQGDPLLGQSLAELSGASGGGQARQFAAQGFDFRRPIQSQHATQIGGRVFLERLRAFDAPQRHEQEREQTGAQPIKGRTQAAVNFLCALENTTGDQDRKRQENPGAWHRRGATKQGRRVLQQA